MKILILLISLGLGVIGSIAAGIVHDLLWAIGDYAMVNINQCDTLEHGWKTICEDVKSKYDGGKAIFYLGGFVATVVGVFLFFSRLD